MTSKYTEAQELRSEGLSYKQIAVRLGISYATAYDRVAKQGRAKSPAFVPAYATETPAQSRARVAREIAEGKRCQHRGTFGRPCSLLRPCADHEVTP